MSGPVIRSEHILLRPLALGDAMHFANLLGPDPAGTRMTSSVPHPCTEEAARNWIGRRIGPGAFGRCFAIIHGEHGKFLGAIAFGGVLEIGIGYWVGRPYRGHGYATEAVQLLLGYVAGLGISRIVSETLPDNPASARVLSKAGFQFLGKKVRHFPVHGGLREVERYGVDLVAGPYQLIRWKMTRG
jgi:ribosomal-protein-alanine N-acetyltransferase